MKPKQKKIELYTLILLFNKLIFITKMITTIGLSLVTMADKESTKMF
jgi:hypothetical protein